MFMSTCCGRSHTLGIQSKLRRVRHFQSYLNTNFSMIEKAFCTYYCEGDVRDIFLSGRETDIGKIVESVLHMSLL